MNRLSDISTIRDILARHGFTFSKALGQNFLINPSVCPRMAQSSGADEHTGVLEIGPGIGVLTRELAACAQKVVSVELDTRLLPVLEETLSDFSNVKVVNKDIMKIDLAKLLQDEFGDIPVAVCANLPYYITSPVIMRLLEEKLPISSITVMVQKEAAERICALPGKRECGAVSAAVRYYSEPEILFQVSRGSFMPAPKVDSAVIRLNIHKEPPVKVANEKEFFKLVRAAFSQRRKTAANSISSGLGRPKAEVIEALNKAQISPTARAEQFSLEQFADLAEQLNKEEEH